MVRAWESGIIRALWGSGAEAESARLSLGSHLPAGPVGCRAEWLSSTLVSFRPIAAALS